MIDAGGQMLCTSSRNITHDRTCRHPPEDRKSFGDVISDADELRSVQVVSLPLIITQNGGVG